VLEQRLQSLVVVVEAVHRRHNTSAILRSAEAFGLHEVHLVTGEFRPSRGAARGAERWLEIHRHADIAAVASHLRGRGFSLWVAHPVAGAATPGEIPVDRPIALLFGSELEGVSARALALADGVVSIPMRGLTASLNVSVAAAVVLADVAERRRALLGGGDLDPDRREAFYRGWLDAEARAEAGLRAQLSIDPSGLVFEDEP
jgi:tRNA (guanosine-2'-O-)-methyltransferase